MFSVLCSNNTQSFVRKTANAIKSTGQKQSCIYCNSQCVAEKVSYGILTQTYENNCAITSIKFVFSDSEYQWH